MTREVKMNKAFKVVDDRIIVTLTYNDGEVVQYTLPKGLEKQAAGHGALRKLGDLANGGADVSEVKEEVANLLNHWSEGRWVNRGPASGTSVVMRALMEHTGKSATEVRDFLKGKTMKQKADIKLLPGVRDIVARLEAEENDKAETLDEESLLEGL